MYLVCAYLKAWDHFKSEYWTNWWETKLSESKTTSALWWEFLFFYEFVFSLFLLNHLTTVWRGFFFAISCRHSWNNEDTSALSRGADCLTNAKWAKFLCAFLLFKTSTSSIILLKCIKLSVQPIMLRTFCSRNNGLSPHSLQYIADPQISATAKTFYLNIFYLKKTKQKKTPHDFGEKAGQKEVLMENNVATSVLYIKVILLMFSVTNCVSPKIFLNDCTCSGENVLRH